MTIRVLVLCAAGLALAGTLYQKLAPGPSIPHPRGSSAPSNSLIGEYVVGTGLYGTVLKLLPNSRFEFSTYRDVVGAPNKHNRGLYQLRLDVLTLTPEERIVADEEWERLGTRLLVITWGARKYLVPLVPSESEAILGFCNSINLGYEPRQSTPGYPYLRAGDERKQVSGLPTLPSKWRRFLLKKPIEGKIIRLVGGDVAEINVGKTSGLKPGMALVDKRTRPYGNQFIVLSVEQKTSRLKQERDIGSEAIRLGEVLTTLAWVEAVHRTYKGSHRHVSGNPRLETKPKPSSAEPGRGSAPVMVTVPVAPVPRAPQGAASSPVKVTGTRLDLTVTLSPALQRAIGDRFPGYSLPQIDWFQPGLVLDLPSETGINPSVPFAAVGDFDGNKLLDAVLLLQKQRQQWLLVAFHQMADGSFTPYRIGWWHEKDWKRMGAIQPPARRKIEFYIEQLSGGLIKDLTGNQLPYDGIYATVSGSVAETLFYRDGKYYYVDRFAPGKQAGRPVPHEPSQGGPMQQGGG